MGQRTVLLIIGLLAGIVLAAAAVDIVAPTTPVANPGFLFGLARRPFDRPPGRPDAPRDQFEPPRSARLLAGVATLVGYGLVLIYLAPRRISTLVRVLLRPPADLLRYGIVGLVLLVLLVTLTLLATISLIALPLVPLLSFGMGAALLTGVVMLALALGYRLRIRVGELERYPLADLVVGMLAILLVATLPVVGTVVLIGCGVVGMGALVLTHFGLSDTWRPEPLDYE